MTNIDVARAYAKNYYGAPTAIAGSGATGTWDTPLNQQSNYANEARSVADKGDNCRYALQSDAAGLVMGTYDTTKLPVYKYLHEAGHPKYAILDNFFQAAFGGSYLNHQWLIAAASPVCNAANGCPANATHSVLDRNGSPTLVSPPASNQPPGMGPLYTSPDTGLVNGVLTQSCGLTTTHAGLACGDFSVNTQQPIFQPSGLFGAKLPAQTNPTIGDRLNAKGVDWAWYSGGWSNANGDVTAPGYTNGTSPPRRRPVLRPERRPRRRQVAGVPGQPVPVPPSAVQLLRQLLDADSLPGSQTAPPTCATSRSSSRTRTARRATAT